MSNWGSGESVVKVYNSFVTKYADGVMRAAYCLTLDRVEAGKLVKTAFKDLSTKGDQIKDDLSQYVSTIKFVWEKHKKGEKLKKQTKFTKLLSGMDETARFVLILVDVLGFAVKEVGEIVGKEEEEIRSHLLTGRKTILDAEF